MRDLSKYRFEKAQEEVLQKANDFIDEVRRYLDVKGILQPVLQMVRKKWEQQGIFVTPSKMEAIGYSGNGKVYSKRVKLTDVAQIDITQGQYARVEPYIDE